MAEVTNADDNLRFGTDIVISEDTSTTCKLDISTIFIPSLIISMHSEMSIRLDRYFRVYLST